MQNRKIVCIDSDGCAMDTMNYKHIYCFGPIAVRVFNIKEKEEFLKKWNKINLYSKTRGVNRFVGISLVFDSINKPLNDLKSWINSTNELSNKSLEKEISKKKSGELEKALIWSNEVNRKIESIKYMAKPFSSVKDAIHKMKKYVDIAIVSAANNEAIKDEWEKFGLIDYVDYVMGQSQGTKKDCIKYLIDKGYEPKNIVMMGDSPGDILSAKENNVLMYPIIVNEENKSWDLFINHILEKFLKDEYKDTEYIEKYERKLGDLDAKNS